MMGDGRVGEGTGLVLQLMNRRRAHALEQAAAAAAAAALGVFQGGG